LVILTVVYLLLAGYWGIAFVSGNQRFYFPFLWRYWFPRSDNNGSVSEETDLHVEVKSVAKSYGTVAAVKDVSIRLERGEITALLGKCWCRFAVLLPLLLCFPRAALTLPQHNNSLLHPLGHNGAGKTSECHRYVGPKSWS
jgi:hypothetical protein